MNICVISLRLFLFVELERIRDVRVRMLVIWLDIFCACFHRIDRPLLKTWPILLVDMPDSGWWEVSYKRVSWVTAERPLYVHDFGITAVSQIWDNYGWRQLEL